jgi:hypothetical protein
MLDVACMGGCLVVYVTVVVSRVTRVTSSSWRFVDNVRVGVPVRRLGGTL